MRLRTAALGLVLLCAAVAPVTPAFRPGLGSQSGPPDRSGWNRRPAGAGDYQIVMEVSGRAEISQLLAPPTDAENLQSICDARREAAAGAIPATERYLARIDASNVVEIAWARRSLGQLHAYDGHLEKAAEQFTAAYDLLSKRAALPGVSEAVAWLEAAIGVAHLRRGELENCVDNHHASSCIFPIADAARHHRPSGSQMAADFFVRHLKRHPDNLEVRWLLNVAHMTLGTYPAGVPKAQLIPAESFASAENPGRFIDVAHRAGLEDVGRAGGAVVEDMDNDGSLDIVISSADPCAPLRYFRNARDGTFTDRTKETGLDTQLGGINLVQTDYDNDGWIDLFVMRGGWEFPMRNSLLRNEQGRRFVDVTKSAGLSSGAHRTHTASWADFDNDGLVDVFVGHEETPSALFKNRGDGTFVNVARAAGVAATSFTKGATWGDYDNDGFPDLYVSNYGSDNFLYRNNRNGTFTEVAKTAGVEKPVMSFPAWFFDYDNDGWLDLFVANYVPSVTEVVRGFLGLPRQAETQKLYRNTQNGRFEDVTVAMHLDRVVPTMGANFGDIDNDGFLDIYLGTGAPSYAAIMPNVTYRNHEGRYFADVTTATGTGHLQKGHGVAFGDVDADGDQDLYVNIGGFVPGDAYHRVLFSNPGGGGNWLKVRLVGAKSNRAAIGARLKVVAPSGPSDVASADVASGFPPSRAIQSDGALRRGHAEASAEAGSRTSSSDVASGFSRTIYRVISSGGSFGASSFTQHIGLGKATKVRTLEVTWPGGARQTFQDIDANQAIEIREGETEYQGSQGSRGSRGSKVP